MFPKSIITASAIGLATLGMVQAAPLSTDEVQGLALINQVRQKVGQAPLAWDDAFKQDAHVWSGNLAADNKLEHAPASDRNGAGELLSMFRTEDRNSVQMTRPITESSKNWLNADGQQQSTDVAKQLGLAEQLLSGKATRIGCATSTINGNSESQWFLYTVCRVHADIQPAENNSLDRRGGGAGVMTWFNPSLGSCGRTNGDNDMVVAISHITMGDAGGNPNNNPNCGKTITISRGGITKTATIVDKCMGCGVDHIDVSPAVFRAFADLGAGKIGDVKWSF
ncbi:Allergen Asp f 7 [Colletotrichum sp. SAR 10_65]|nr:Allergen Asp f 7 [Colletotrichum sp. SAR 10_65]KAI8177289.1 Allergen Asp f 7 [Colletotrichum sp. SAR 10_75]KAI8204947.1 Allergen Asp f 7 [Colletotrichum sp. SAR 10_76]KAI8250598.1 Allergen Asp f 7 [Colletotrichum sp. SAR 10_77]